MYWNIVGVNDGVCFNFDFGVGDCQFLRFCGDGDFSFRGCGDLVVGVYQDEGGVGGC